MTWKFQRIMSSTWYLRMMRIVCFLDLWQICLWRSLHIKNFMRFSGWQFSRRFRKSNWFCLSFLEKKTNKYPILRVVKCDFLTKRTDMIDPRCHWNSECALNVTWWGYPSMHNLLGHCWKIFDIAKNLIGVGMLVQNFKVIGQK